MATTTTSSVYIHVIEDVISKVREEFIGNGGPGESVLNELQGIWEMKMMQAGVLLGPIERNSGQRQPIPGGPTPVHDLNVPYEQTEEYETPTAEILFPPTPLQTPAPTPLTGSIDNSGYNIPTGTSDYPTPASDGGGNSDIKGVRPSPYMQPPSPWPNARTPLGVDVNVAYVEGRDEGDRAAARQPPAQDFLMVSAGKRKREEIPSRFQNGGYIPQQDGAGDAEFDTSTPLMNQGSRSTSRHDFWCTSKRETVAEMGKTVSKIPQLDGPIPDPYEDMLSTPNIYNYQVPVQEDYNLVNTPAPELQAPTPAAAPQIDALEDDEDEPLNENDDDDDVDDVDQGDELNTQHLVLAQFDKVTRTKSRWKCTLKDGIMHINNKDILFNKATGEFEF